MPGPTDTGLDNLERYIEAVTAATREIQESTGSLEQLDGLFSGFESGIEEALGGYADELDRVDGELAGDQQQAHSSVDGLGQMLQSEAEELSSSLASIDPLESQFGERISAARADWDQDLSSLSQGGFQSLDTDLETVHGSTQASADQVDAAFDVFEQALPPIQGDLESLRSETDAKMEALQIAIEGTETTELATEAGTCATEFTDLQQQIDTECTTIKGATETLYTSWGGELEKQGEDFQDAFDTLMDDSAKQVGDAAHDEVEEPIDEALTGYLQPLSEELDGLDAVLEPAAAIAGRLEPMLDDLEIAPPVARQIHEVLESLDTETP